MQEKASVPAIRFAGFTDAWEQRKLGELAEIVGGGTPSTGNPEYWDGNIDWYAPAEIADQIYLESSQRKITELGYDSSSAKILPPGTVLFTSRAGIGKTAILARKGCTNQGFQSIVPHKGELDSYFIFSRTEELKQYGELVGAGSTFVEVSGKQMAAMELMMPSTMREQQKIGTFFRHLDHLITLHQRKYSRLCNIKKSMLERMFPKEGASVPEIRFAGFTDAWEQRKLGGLVQFSKGTGYSKADLKEKGTPIILYGRLYTKYETVISDVDTYADARDGSVYSRGGEVIVPASGETAEDISVASVVEKSGILLGGDLNIITPPADLDPAFLAISISNGKPHDDMAKMAQGKSVVHLHNADLEKIDLMYPCYTEQMQISTYFKNLDHLITLHQRELERLQNIKKACLEKMFV
jgi:type I restriction enzyme S subunit